MKKILTIAGSDSGGCAGIQADIKTISALGGFGMSVITAITAQNTTGVTHIEELSIDSIAAQINAIYDDLEPDALKSGMLFSKNIIDTVSDILKERNKSPYVLDPVMVATSGAKLLQDDAIDSMINKLFPLADVVTPNLPEAELLSNMKIKNYDDVEVAAKKILELGPKSVIIKGGHFEKFKSVDILLSEDKIYEFESERIETKNTHGTGCTFSSAIATHLGQSFSLIDSVKHSKAYITSAIIYGANLNIGKGFGPVNHFFNNEIKSDGTTTFGSCSI